MGIPAQLKVASPLVTIILLAILSAGLLFCGRQADSTLTENVILITLDGLRYQELFYGIDRSFVDEKYQDLLTEFDGPTAADRRQALLPFFWNTLAPQGIVLGNHLEGSDVRVTNPHLFSYPGYAELLTGRPIASIDSNDANRIPEPTVLEFVRRRLNLPVEKVASFASWEVFDAIVESEPGSIFNSAGTHPLTATFGSPTLQLLDRLQHQLILPFDTVRNDAVTFQMALEYLRLNQPRLLYLALDETDDWAHQNRYDRVIRSIRVYDDFFKELWTGLESDPVFRGRTTLIITSDHGRGVSIDDWSDHGKDVAGAEFIFLAIIGPDTPDRGMVAPSPPVTQSQIAATLLEFFDLPVAEYSLSAGQPISAAFR